MSNSSYFHHIVKLDNYATFDELNLYSDINTSVIIFITGMRCKYDEYRCTTCSPVNKGNRTMQLVVREE